MGIVINIHERVIAAPADVVGPLLDKMGGDDDVLWPAPDWTPMILDGPVAVGADGGHGPIRYAVSEYEPGRRVRFEFHPSVGLDGYHEGSVIPLDDSRCVMRHVTKVRPRRQMTLLWPSVIRRMHDEVIEDLLDNAERAAAQAMGTEPPAGRKWPLAVRMLRILERIVERPSARAVAVPDRARLAHSAFATRAGRPIDFADAFEVARARTTPSDPAVWAHAIFFDPPRWVGALLVARNVLVRAVGIEQGDERAFATVATSEDEVLLGSDSGHLDFRASILVDRQTVTLSTLVQINNRRGRLYMAVVRRVHPVVVRSMLLRAARRLAQREPAGPASDSPQATPQGSPTTPPRTTAATTGNHAASASHHPQRGVTGEK